MTCSYLRLNRELQAPMPASHVADRYSTSVHKKVSKLPISLQKTFSICQNLSTQTYIIQSQKPTNLLPY